MTGASLIHVVMLSASLKPGKDQCGQHTNKEGGAAIKNLESRGRLNKYAAASPGPRNHGLPELYYNSYNALREPTTGGGSSNGRTADSDSASLGSNPSPPATFSKSCVFNRSRRRGEAEALQRGVTRTSSLRPS